MNSIEISARTVKRYLRLADHSNIVNIVRPFYNRYLRLLYGRQGLRRDLGGGLVVRIRPRYRDLKENYEGPILSFLRHTLQAGDVVLEVGANVGFLTVALANWVGPTGRVYAFEPVPETREVLADHLTMNGVADRAVVSPLAVSDIVGESWFSRNGTVGTNRIIKDDGENSFKVQLTTIDEFCFTNDVVPSLIKIDIEGYEFHALRGARETLARHRPLIIVELHPMFWPAIGAHSGELTRLLDDFRYHLTPLDDQVDPLSSYGHVLLTAD